MTLNLLQMSHISVDNMSLIFQSITHESPGHYKVTVSTKPSL